MPYLKVISKPDCVALGGVGHVFTPIRFCSLISLVLLIGATGCQSKSTVDPEKIVQFGTTKADLFGMPAEYRSIHPHLEKLLEGPVMFRSQPDGPAIAEQLRQGLIHYGIMTAGEYAAVQDVSQLKAVAMGTNALGKTSRKAHIVVKAHSHVKTIKDCKGKRFGFGIYKDTLTDKAAQAALENAGVPVKDLLPELLTPPPLGLEGRLYLNRDVAKTIANDPTVNAGVVDEVDYAAMKETGGSFLLGPSKDQLSIVGETISVPELMIVAGPSADPGLTEKLRRYLLDEVKSDARVCKDLGVTGFAEPDLSGIEAVRAVVMNK